MKAKSISLVLLLLLAYACKRTDWDSTTTRVQALLTHVVDDQQCAGISYLIKADTNLLLAQQYGYGEVTKKERLTQNTTFRIASLTKPITATAILQLVEADRISLSQTIDSFFPDFPAAQQISIYHLLTHTSGIPNWYEGGMPEDEPHNFPMCENPHRYLAKMQTSSLFAPGTAWSYSNSGYVLLGEIIELITGMSYAEYIQQNILAKAKMTHTAMEYIDQPQPRWATGYVHDPEQETGFAPPAVYHMPFSAGGLRSTAQDVMLFLEALADGVLLSQAMYADMTAYAQLNNGQLVYENLYSPTGEPPRFPANIQKYGYGMGFQIAENFGKKFIFHGGDIAGFQATLMLIPHNSLRAVILANTENGFMSVLQDIERQLIKMDRP